MQECGVIIIGAGASGMAAALACARGGKKVIILEKETLTGRKILVSGNGRCNFTNANAAQDKYFGAKHLIKSALSNLSPKGCLAFFEDLGLLYKEEDGRFFPITNKSSAVNDTLLGALAEAGVEIKLRTQALKIARHKNGYKIDAADGQSYFSPYVVLACGSCAFPQVGAGDFGYALAKQLGHKITALKPALCSIDIKEKAVSRLLGLKVYAKVSLMKNNKIIDAEAGEIIFNAQGISGNNVLSLSRNCEEGDKVLIDFLPQFNDEEFTKFINARKAKMAGRRVKDFFSGMLAEGIANLLIDYLGLRKNSLMGEIRPDIFDRIIKTIKCWPLTAGRGRGWKEASAARGGVCGDEINEDFSSKQAKGVFITGELLDVDGRCGGFNLHFAWASGLRAAKAINDLK